MSENPGTDVTVDVAPAQADPKPTDIDWKAQARKWEAQAKANKDAVDRLAFLEESQKSGEQWVAGCLVGVGWRA